MTRTAAPFRPLAGALLALLCLAAPAPGQPDDGTTSGVPAARMGAALAPAAKPVTGSGEVTLTVRSFGLGNRARAGSWIGVQVEVDDRTDKVRNVIVRLRVADVDGDAALMQRVIISNPGTVQKVWLYTRLPFAASDSLGTYFDLTAHESIDEGTGDAVTHTPGRLLGTTRYQAGGAGGGAGQNGMITPYCGAIAVIGGRDAGLARYQELRDSPQVDNALTGHELTEVVAGLRLADVLPDRWMGYEQFEALAWTAFAEEDRPDRLSPSQAAAIKEWVARGGHLVVVLPNVQQPWVGNAAGAPTHPLADVMPRCTAARAEGVDLARYRRLLTADDKVQLPQAQIVHTFTPAPGAAPGEFVPVMTGPDGEVVVARRTVGAGAVTVIGIDVASPRLATVQSALQTDVFWNRVLGKRLRTVPRDELALGAQGKKLPNGKDARSYAYSEIKSANIDALLPAYINNTGRAGLGVLLAFLVFVAYWLLAGPLGYFVLKQRGWKRHAWAGFVAATALFTAVAWGGASALKPHRVEGRHFTVLDGVYGQPLQRARSWMGLVLPRYGEERLSVAPAAGPGGAGADTEVTNAIAAWDGPRGLGAATEASFPDNRAYVVETRRPDTITVPARSTTKQVQVEWTGAVPATWGMPRPLAEANVPVGEEVRVVKRADALPGERAWRIEGTLVHALPGPLKNVRVLVNLAPERLNAPTDQTPPYLGYLVKLTASTSSPEGNLWKPQQALVLDDLFPKTAAALTPSSARSAFAAMVPQVGALNYGADVPLTDATGAMSFLDMLEPPPPVGRNSGYARAAVRRYGTHGLDLSRWCTQPCVIVLGELGEEGEKNGVECPVPLGVGALGPEEVRPRVKGKTLVRWVYPLAAAPMKAELVTAGGAGDGAGDVGPSAAPRPGETEGPTP